MRTLFSPHHQVSIATPVQEPTAPTPPWGMIDVLTDAPSPTATYRVWLVDADRIVPAEPTLEGDDLYDMLDTISSHCRQSGTAIVVHCAGPVPAYTDPCWTPFSTVFVTHDHTYDVIMPPHNTQWRDCAIQDPYVSSSTPGYHNHGYGYGVVGYTPEEMEFLFGEEHIAQTPTAAPTSYTAQTSVAYTHLPTTQRHTSRALFDGIDYTHPTRIGFVHDKSLDVDHEYITKSTQHYDPMLCSDIIDAIKSIRDNTPNITNIDTVFQILKEQVGIKTNEEERILLDIGLRFFLAYQGTALDADDVMQLYAMLLHKSLPYLKIEAHIATFIQVTGITPTHPRYIEFIECMISDVIEDADIQDIDDLLKDCPVNTLTPTVFGRIRHALAIDDFFIAREPEILRRLSPGYTW